MPTYPPPDLGNFAQATGSDPAFFVVTAPTESTDAAAAASAEFFRSEKNIRALCDLASETANSVESVLRLVRKLSGQGDDVIDRLNHACNRILALEQEWHRLGGGPRHDHLAFLYECLRRLDGFSSGPVRSGDTVFPNAHYAAFVGMVIIAQNFMPPEAIDSMEEQLIQCKCGRCGSAIKKKFPKTDEERIDRLRQIAEVHAGTEFEVLAAQIHVEAGRAAAAIPPQPKPSKKPRRKAEELNVLVRIELRNNPRATAEQVAKRLGSNRSQVVGTPSWKAVQEALQKGRQPKRPRTVHVNPDSLPAPATTITDELAQEVESRRPDAEAPRKRSKL